MSVFLRWGIFGILGMAALIYAYNASKRVAEARSTQKTQAPVAAPREAGAAPALDSQAELTPRCQAELDIARRALEARRQSEPIDRLLRIHEIAFQEQPWRARLESVATRWYQWTGDEPTPEALRDAVVRNCELFTPAP